MNADIIAYALENGYKELPQNIICDGNIHRFGKKDRYWYIGSTLHKANGDAINIVTFGDWTRESPQITYKPSGKFTKIDTATIRAAIEIQQKKLEQEKIASAIKAEEKAKAMWSIASGDVADHDYILRKKITVDTKIKRLQNELLIPCRNIEGNLKGLQRIFPNGDKRFIFGQRNDGVFHTIGNIALSDTVYLCEGYATGASIHEATSGTVVIAFNASNMLNVARDLCREFPEKNVIVCGDDDYRNDVNTGVDYAFKAAKYTRIEPVFPVFKDKNNRGTDFNDLHVIEGIDALKKCFEDEPEKEGFEFLGYEGDNHYFYIDNISNIKVIKNFTENDLFMLAPLDYWEEMFPKKSGFDISEARSFLINESKKRKIYNPDYNRGCGVWSDNNRVVFNDGTNIFCDGEKVKRKSFKTRYRYIQTKRRLDYNKLEPLSTDETKQLINIAEKFNWAKEDFPYFFMGWIAQARIAGALPIRPHVWITGQKGSGKTTIVEKFIKPLLGQDVAYLYAEGGTSEAGIRQTLVGSSIPLVFDEFENEGKKTDNENQKILSLFRQTWSNGSAQILKGTAGGQAMSFKPCFAGLVASISDSLQTAADRSRFSMLEINPASDSKNDWNEVSKLLSAIDEEMGERLFLRSLKNAKNIIASFRIIQKIIADQANGRIGDHNGMLIASYWSLISDVAITQTEAETLVSVFNFSEEIEADKAESDELNLINSLLTKTIDIHLKNGMKRTDQLGEIILSFGKENETYGGVKIEHDLSPYLKQFGIVVEENYVWFANKHTELSKLLSDTKYANGKWRGFLKRLDGSEAKRKRYGKFEGQQSSVGIPISYIHDVYSW